jgi:hypothetical protein
MTKPTNERPRPLTEQEMQVSPLPGEADPKDARRLATHIAAVERLRQASTLRRTEPAVKSANK